MTEVVAEHQIALVGCCIGCYIRVICMYVLVRETCVNGKERVDRMLWSDIVEYDDQTGLWSCGVCFG